MKSYSKDQTCVICGETKGEFHMISISTVPGYACYGDCIQEANGRKDELREELTS